MKNVLNKLHEFNSQIDLKNRFDYVFNNDSKIFTNSEIESLNEKSNNYDKNIHLKALLKIKYENLEEDSTSIDFWLINQWGGINGFKPNERNITKINTFKEQLKKGKLSKDTFGTISSLSKVSSFLNPKEYVIYDSRVIYALNWLILTTENNESLKSLYFPMPTSRNKILTDFDMNTIINLSHINSYTNGEKLFIPYQTAYFQFCKFIKEGAIELYGAETKPYQLEMLLFTLADNEIFNEIKNKIKISTVATY